MVALRAGNSAHKGSKMSSLSKQEQLRRLIDEQLERLRQSFPIDRGIAVVALTRARDWRYLESRDALNDVTKGANDYLYYSGWQRALLLCFREAVEFRPVSAVGTDSGLDDWADQVLGECDRLTAGEQVLAYCESGFMRMQQGGERDFYAWVASKKMPTEWREREDLAWWMNALARSYEGETREIAAENGAIQQELDAFAGEWRADGTVYANRSFF
jgi:hypothetical protein